VHDYCGAGSAHCKSLHGYGGKYDGPKTRPVVTPSTNNQTPAPVQQTRPDASNAKIETLEQQKASLQLQVDNQRQTMSRLQRGKQDLESELDALKKSSYASQDKVKMLTNQIQSLDTQIQTLMRNIEATSLVSIETIRSLYDDRMSELQDAKSRELAAIQENNQLKYNQALEDQNKAAKDVIDLKKDYDFMVTDLRVIRAQITASTSVITQVDQEIQSLRNRLDTLTDTPAPTQPPIQWGTSLYVLIDANAWLNDGVIVVMAMNGTEVVTQPFQYRNMLQVFVISSQGHLRCLDKMGYFVTASESCLVPQGTETPPEKNWRIRRVSGGHSSQYSIMSEACGSFMVSAVDQVTLERMPQTEGWFVIPVGRMQPPMLYTRAPMITTPPPTTTPPSMSVGDLPTNPPANPLDLESYVGYELNTAKTFMMSRYEGVSILDMDVSAFATTRIQSQPNTVYLIWKPIRVMDGDIIVTKKIVQTVFGTIEKLETTDRPTGMPTLPTVTTSQPL